MTVDVNDVIAEVRVKSRGRTRYEGQEPYQDELLVAEIDRLRAVVDRLPHTADGVPVMPAIDKVHHPEYGAGYIQWDQSEDDEDTWTLGNTGIRVSDCYSTREAAIAAREGGGE